MHGGCITRAEHDLAAVTIGMLTLIRRARTSPPWPARSTLTPIEPVRLTKRQAREMVKRLSGKGGQAGTPAPLLQEEGSPKEQSNGVAQAFLPACGPDARRSLADQKDWVMATGPGSSTSTLPSVCGVTPCTAVSSCRFIPSGCMAKI